MHMEHWFAHINNTRNMPLNRRTAEQQVDLVITVPIPPEILDDPQTCLAIRNSRIVVVLLAVLINGEALLSMSVLSIS